MDWKAIRAHKLSPERPPEWDADIKAISLEGLNLFGIHEKHGTLYWDGKEVVTRGFRLAPFERWIASVAAVGTFGNFLVHAARALGWWH